MQTLVANPLGSTLFVGFDFSDAPATVDWSGAEIGKFYRPTKKPVTMRLDCDVIAWLRADNRGKVGRARPYCWIGALADPVQP
jgi:hypothetical protein